MTKTQTPRTAHACGGPSFGRLTPGCPRCDELAAGAPARSWNVSRTRRTAGRDRAADLAAHFSGEKHRSGGCGPVCTYGEW